MKDEIKEILDNFKNYEERYKKCNENQFIIFYRDIHLLLDYITNLQEENKNSFEKGYAEGIIVAELDNENEFIVAYKELKQRIDKAIEYIEKQEDYFNDYPLINRQDLLNILNGGDE